MGRKKAQVAMYVLIGLIILIGIILAIYLIKQKQVETNDYSNNEQLYADNPELAAEVARMQERANDCLERTLKEEIAYYQELGTLPNNEAELTAFLEEAVRIDFTDCFYDYPILERLIIQGDEEPEVTVTLGPNSAIAFVRLPVAGEYEGEGYRLSDYQATVPTSVQPDFNKMKGVEEELLDPAKANELFSDDCGLDPYGLVEEGLYADVLILDDGTRVVWLYDYNDYLDGKTEESPSPVRVDLPPCEPKTANSITT